MRSGESDDAAQVWLLLIPLFHCVWAFVFVSRMASSLANEFHQRSIPIEPDPGKTLGLAYCILGICGLLPMVGILASLGGIVCWILYWIKIANYSALLAPPSAAI